MTTHKGIRFWPVAAYVLVLAAIVLWRIRPESDEAVYDQPALLDWAHYPGLVQLGTKIAGEVGGAAPEQARMTLSPTMWRRLGCDASGAEDNATEITIPLGCLAIWSVLDFHCYIAHRAVCRRANPWLFGPARSLLARLTAERVQNVAQRISNPKARNVERFAKVLAGLLTNWQLVIDVEADRRVAKVYGEAAVADWIQRSALANISIPACLASIIEPAATRGQLLPIAEACRAWHKQNESPWKDALMNAMRSADRSGLSSGLDPVIIRLGVLQRQAGPSAPYDPRPAIGLIEDLASLEERALRNEVADVPQGLYRVQIAELGAAVVIPQMEEEVARNATLLIGQDLCNIPELVQRAGELAAGYSEEPRYLLTRNQRELMVPHLLAAFLVIGLVRSGWSVRYSVEDGLLLKRGKRELNPEAVVRELGAGEMSHEEFLSILAESSDE